MKSERSYYPEIFLLSFGALLLEISYTRIFSFKLLYYFAYFVIGFALLGFASGGVCVTLSRRLRGLPLDKVIGTLCLLSATTVGISYLAIARMEVSLWHSLASPAQLGRLILLSGFLFASFLGIGIVIAELLGRNSFRVNRLYFADLLGAGVACAVAIPLLSFLSPPSTVFLSAALMASAGVMAGLPKRPILSGINGAAMAASVLAVIFADALPDVVTDTGKNFDPRTVDREEWRLSEWSTLFRVDIIDPGKRNPYSLLAFHDGILASTLQRFDGDFSKLTRFDTDSRSLGFAVAPDNPEVLIVGAAGGHEVLAYLYFGAAHITAVEINPVIVNAVRSTFSDYVGHIAENPKVDYVNAEARCYLESRPDEKRYDLIYFVAPDSFASMNAATSSAFVLSESYLYTVEMLKKCLDHLTDGGILCLQYGEHAFDTYPTRTARLASTAREAFRLKGIPNFDAHIAVVSSVGFGKILQSTTLLRKTPFTQKELSALFTRMAQLPKGTCRYAPGHGNRQNPITQIITMPAEQMESWHKNYPFDVRPVTDDSPFFWQFVRFRDAWRPTEAGEERLHANEAIGERILLLLLAIAAAFAAVLLLIPFILIRKTWVKLPFKSRTFIYFASLGLGFMLVEITLMQKLALLLGHPTRAISVTLMSMLVFAGLGSLSSFKLQRFGRNALVGLLAAMLPFVLFFSFGIAWVVAWGGALPLVTRALIAAVLIAPLAFCMGCFMPIGLRALSRLSEHHSVYVAWGWAVNGFFSVIGSVLTTIFAIAWGFSAVLIAAMCVYAIAVFMTFTLPRWAFLQEP